MKKCILTAAIAIMSLFLLTVPVLAKDNAVKISSAAASAKAVQVEGTTTAKAVVVQVRNDADEILVMRSMGTLDGKFSGSIEDHLALEEGKTYYVYVADFEGGDWTVADVNVPVITDTTSPKTGESSVWAVCIVGMIGMIAWGIGRYKRCVS